MVFETKRSAVSRNTLSFIKTVTAFIELFIVLRILFDFLRASSSAPFTVFVNSVTDPLLKPFTGIFRQVEVYRGFYLDPSTLFALLFYAFAGYVAGEIARVILRRVKRHKKY